MMVGFLLWKESSSDYLFRFESLKK